MDLSSKQGDRCVQTELTLGKDGEFSLVLAGKTGEGNSLGAFGERLVEFRNGWVSGETVVGFRQGYRGGQVFRGIGGQTGPYQQHGCEVDGAENPRLHKLAPIAQRTNPMNSTRRSIHSSSWRDVGSSPGRA